ncbi:hypothetical protein GOP47_0018624 [Adiantum capillus-veneris]|uniref:UBZ4-type domain-containing protein n=1 Tax=Adiantum capillus-veneris TaxID=13818 RepID=A0A9D4UDX2_ADICA|nr:hypothetical protein GOP47_0018624 [Adiantum capillus-veneris]
MDDVKNQFKGLVKKFTSPSSSSRFKGEGHKLGSGQESSQQPAKAQPPAQQQADWRKLQQERWGRERSPHPTPRQDGSNASTSQPQTSNVHNSSPSIPSSVGSSSKHPNGSSVDGLTAVKVGLPDGAEDLQTGDGSEQPIGALEVGNLDQVSNQECKDAAKLSKVAALCSHGDHEGIVSSSDLVRVASHDSHDAQSTSIPGFDPFSSQIDSLSIGKSMSELQMYQCPVCGRWWKSEKEVNAHIDECLSQSTSTSIDNVSESDTKPDDNLIKDLLGVFLSGGPCSETIDVFLRILRNIVRSPELEKYRKIRLSNPKIHDTVGMALGGVELLEAVGFTYQTEEEEIWAVMDPPSMDKINAMQVVITQLEKCGSGSSKEKISSNEKAPVQRKVDRQVRVFYASPENLAAKMELPDSFFQLSASELRQEAAARKKKLEDSQLLISKVSRDRIATANKRKYKAAIIRIQFPDGVVLQGMFLPWEPTTAIYEFVSNSLRDPSIQFTLVAPGLSRKQAIPAFAEGPAKIPTLEEADLVPAVLVKFQCEESDSLTFTGLHPDILVGIEPLSSTTLPC